jgi:pyrroline-5-carboxylate reductase
MASAMIKGLIHNGFKPVDICVIEPDESARQRLSRDFNVISYSRPDQNTSWAQFELVVWAVKPQQMRDACEHLSTFAQNLLHLSVAAGITSTSLSTWLGTDRVVRAMPNTPALIGMGQTALYARPAVQASERNLIQTVVQGTGSFLWLEQEELLDAVTALSGSGPAYVFYILEALTKAATELGLEPLQAKQLAIGTFIGASHLADQSPDSLKTLREKVTSKGGTTEAAIQSLNQDQVDKHLQTAVNCAHRRAQELGALFGK